MRNNKTDLLVELFQAHPGIPLSIEKIVRHVWDEKYEPSLHEATVYAHITFCRRRGLNIPVRTRGHYIFLPDDYQPQPKELLLERLPTHYVEHGLTARCIAAMYGVNESYVSRLIARTFRVAVKRPRRLDAAEMTRLLDNKVVSIYDIADHWGVSTTTARRFVNRCKSRDCARLN